MDAAIDLSNKQYLTEVIPANTGGGTITYALKVWSWGDNWSEFLICGSYDPRTLGAKQGVICARTLELAGRMPYAVTIDGTTYQLAPYRRVE